MNWTQEITKELISHYESARILWDTRNEAYKNIKKKKQVLNTIAEAMKITEEEVTKKIQGLRTQYYQEKKKKRIQVEVVLGC